MNITEQLKRDEGVVNHAYQDHLGYWTIGAGFLVDKRKGGGLDDEEIEFILDHRWRKVRKELSESLHFFEYLSAARQGVLINMGYQLGVNGVLNFKNTLALIAAKDYSKAAKEMLNSKWAKQTPLRAARLSEQMETGHWK